MLLLTPGHRTACKEYTLNGDKVIELALLVNELFIDYDQSGDQGVQDQNPTWGRDLYSQPGPTH